MSAGATGVKGGNRAGTAVLALALAAIAGCGHKQSVYQPPPQSLPPAQQPQEVRSPNEVTQSDLEYIDTHKPVLTEIGVASWYDAPYKGRRAANGRVFDGDQMTAANRTLPMGSLVVVTNLKTGQSGAMRITDRGPFIAGRILDLSMASAKAIGVYRDGIDRVRLDVYRTPKPIWSGGRWCVQIGPFTNHRKAIRLKKQLMRKYPRASVIEFPGERHQYWVRIRPQNGDRATAVSMTRHMRPSQGVAFLTRLD